MLAAVSVAAFGLTLSGLAPASHGLALHRPRVQMSRLAMCDAGDAEEAPAAEAAPVSPKIAEMMDQIGHMTLMEAAELIKKTEEAFNVGDAANKKDDDDAEE